MIAALIVALAASSISGVVHDASGGVVSGAAVIIRVESSPEQRVTTGPDGRFSVDVAEAREATVIVRAGGFAEKQERVTDTERPLQIVHVWRIGTSRGTLRPWRASIVDSRSSAASTSVPASAPRNASRIRSTTWPTDGKSIATSSAKHSRVAAGRAACQAARNE